MQRFRCVLALTAAVALAGISSGCLATRKYTRNEVKAKTDALDSKLSAQIDATNGQVKETQDSVNRVNQRVTAVDQRVTTENQRLDSKIDTQVAGVNTKVTDLDTKTTTNINGVRTEVTTVRTSGETTTRNLSALDQKFQNRNKYTISDQKSVLFKFDSATLTDEGKGALDQVAQMIMDNADAILVLEGHTDSTGDKTYNIRLGERRVETVRRYLAVDKGVPVFRIEEISFGADKPIVPNDSKTNREQNRAVTLIIMVPPASTATASNR